MGIRNQPVLITLGATDTSLAKEAKGQSGDNAQNKEETASSSGKKNSSENLGDHGVLNCSDYFQCCEVLLQFLLSF